MQEAITGRDHNVRETVQKQAVDKRKIITLKRDSKRLIPLGLAKNITEDDSKRTVAVNADIIRKSMV